MPLDSASAALLPHPLGQQQLLLADTTLQYGFYANTSYPRRLYQGCTRTVSAAQLEEAQLVFGYQPRPGMVLIGAQKAGTTSIDAAIKPVNNYFCSTDEELHFFDDEIFRATSVNSSTLPYYFMYWQPRSCNTTVPRFEKSPAYLSQPWAAKRLCEALPQQKLSAILREPVARAYSSFHETPEYFFTANGGPLNVTKDADGFHQYAKIDMAITESCGGLYDGEPAVDEAAAITYRPCCEAVAAGYGQTSWPGCSCDPHTEYGNHACGTYGDKRAMSVRNSIYDTQLRAFYRYHRQTDLLLFEMTPVINDLPNVARDMAIIADTPSLTMERLERIDSDDAVVQTHANEKADEYKPMHNYTRHMLTKFYRPYNRKLSTLIGRELPWSQPLSPAAERRAERGA